MTGSTTIFFALYFDKELKSNFEYEYLREIPSSEYSPSVASFLVNEQKLDVNSLNSELMDLIRRGYITIDINGQDLTDKNANMIMVLNQDKYQGSNDLTNSEKSRLFSALHSCGQHIPQG